MNCKGCDCASKAQYLPVPAGMIGLVIGGGGRKYALTHLVGVRFGRSGVCFLDVMGDPVAAVLHEPTQVVYELGEPARQLAFSEWLAEVTE